MRNQSTSYKKNPKKNIKNKVSDNLSLPAKRKRIVKDAIITYELKDNELEYIMENTRWWSAGLSPTAISIFLSTLVSLILYGKSNRYVEWILIASFVASIIFFIIDLNSRKKLHELEKKIKNRK